MRWSSIESVRRMFHASAGNANLSSGLANAAGLLLTLILIVSGCRPGGGAPSLTADQHAKNLQSFEEVWTTIRDKHWDPTLGGLDWQAVHDELLPQAERARTMPEARGVMEAMIERLGQSHFGIIPQEIYADVDQASGGASGDGTTGIDVRVVEGQALVTRVEAGSPADSLGVRMGWEVVRVGEEDIPKRLKAVGEQFAGKTILPFIEARSVISRLSGPVGETVKVRLLDGAGKRVELAIPLAQARGHKIGMGNLPAQHVWFKSRRLEDGAGYIAFNMFLDPAEMMPQFDAAMESFLDAPGVIIDLRGNPGGLGGMAMGMAGWLIEEQGRQLGTMHTRMTELKFAVLPRPQTYRGPVAVLVDGLSASTSEIFAGGMKDLGRARIFGARTAGAALPSMVSRLPNGDGFQYAFANYLSYSGAVLEGEGIEPDIAIPVVQSDLLQGIDAPLQAAQAWIRGEQRGR